MAFDACYICDGYNFNCESYQIQLNAKEVNKMAQDEDLLKLEDLDED